MASTENRTRAADDNIGLCRYSTPNYRESAGFGPSSSLIRMQRQFLDTPVRQFTNVQMVIGSTIDCVHQAKLFELLSCRSELPHDPAVQFHLINCCVVHPILVARMGAVEILMRSAADAHGERHANVGDL